MTSYDSTSADHRSPLSQSPGHEVPTTVRGGRLVEGSRGKGRLGGQLRAGRARRWRWSATKVRSIPRLSIPPVVRTPRLFEGGRVLGHNGLTRARWTDRWTRPQQRGAGSRQLRTARAQCKVHSCSVDAQSSYEHFKDAFLGYDPSVRLETPATRWAATGRTITCPTTRQVGGDRLTFWSRQADGRCLRVLLSLGLGRIHEARRPLRARHPLVSVSSINACKRISSVEAGIDHAPAVRMRRRPTRA